MTELVLAASAQCAAGLPAAFAAHRPDLAVTVASGPGDPGWFEADVVWWGAFQPPGVGPQGSRPLDDLAATAGFDQRPFGKLVDLERAGGRLHALPVDYAAPALVYNLDILAGFGAAPPPQDLTWSGLIELAEALRGAGDAVAFGDGAYGWTAALLAWQAGVDPDDLKGLHPFVQRVRDLRRRAAVPPAPESFARGRTALAINDSGVEAMGIDPALRWGVAPIPLVDPHRPRRTLWRRSHVYVHVRSKHPDDAFALASFVPRWAAGRGPAALGAFPAYRPAEMRGHCSTAHPTGLPAFRASAEDAAPEEWDAGAPFADRQLWAGLLAAIEEGWDRDRYADRLRAVQAAAPT